MSRPSIEVIRAQLEDARTNKNWGRCIVVCRRGLQLNRHKLGDDWYGLQINMGLESKLPMDASRKGSHWGSTDLRVDRSGKDLDIHILHVREAISLNTIHGHDFLTVTKTAP